MAVSVTRILKVQTSIGVLRVPILTATSNSPEYIPNSVYRDITFDGVGGAPQRGSIVSPLNVGESFTIGSESKITVTRSSSNFMTISAPGAITNTCIMDGETTFGRLVYLAIMYTATGVAYAAAGVAYPKTGDSFTLTNFIEWTSRTGNSMNSQITTWNTSMANILLAAERPSDPFFPGGWSENGGGTGDFDATSDVIGEPLLPTLSAINTGFLTLFVPTISQLASLQQYLWGDLISGLVDHSLDEIVDSLNKLVANPYDAIMGLSILPVAIPTSGTKDVKMYGVLQSGVEMAYASTQWVTVDCGSLNINEFWGAYLDYSPYTKVTSLYLPYIGTVTLDVDEIMNKTLQVKYHVDVLTGQCVAYIIINGSVEYQYQGECAVSVPVTAQDFSGIVTAGMSLLASGLSFAAGGAAASAAAAGLGAGSSGSKIATAGAREAGAIAGQASSLASGVGNVMNMKPNIKAGGPIGGAGGMLAVQKPYLIIIRPRQCVAEKQNTYTGYPLNKTMRVGDCSGYTEFSSINLDGIPLTDDEKAELQAIMMGGVYL